MWKRRLTGVVLGLYCSCAGIVTAPTPDQQMWWDRAVEELESYGFFKARIVDADSVNFVPVGDAFSCDGYLSNGCYSPSNHTISYNIETPQVLQHESEHAILHLLGYSRRVYLCIPEHHDELGCFGWPWR